MHGLYKCVLTFCAVFVGLGVRGDGFLGTAGCDVPVCGHGAGGCAGAYRREVWP